MCFFRGSSHEAGFDFDCGWVCVACVSASKRSTVREMARGGRANLWSPYVRPSPSSRHRRGPDEKIELHEI